MLVTMIALIVRSQRISAEVTLKTAPGSVDMVGAVLGVVVFNNEGRTLDSIIVRLPRLVFPGPGKIQALQAVLFYFQVSVMKQALPLQMTHLNIPARQGVSL